MPVALLALILAVDFEPEPTWATRSPGKYLISAAETAIYEGGIYVTDRWVLRGDYTLVTPDTLRDNLVNGPRFDNDPIFVNFLGHPYQGAVAFGFVRSAGVGFWGASLYTLIADAAWEWLAEVQAPSINDLVESGPAASLWGEALFRTSRLVLYPRGGENVALRFLRILFAFAIDPSATANSIIIGVPESEQGPRAVLYRARIYGGVLAWAGRTSTAQGLVGADLVYGLPEAPSSACVSPFDIFELRAAGAFGNLVTGDGGVRGILAGCGFGAEGPPGAWGLFSSTDFGTSVSFRWSTTSTGPGATIRLHRPHWELRTTATAEAVLMGAAGATSDTDYVAPNDTLPGVSHYSMGPGGLASVNVELSLYDRLRLYAAAQSSFIAALVPPGGGWERIDRFIVGLELDLPLSLFAAGELRVDDRAPARPAETRESSWSGRGLLGVRL
jgi:hypothetical protein